MRFVSTTIIYHCKECGKPCRPWRRLVEHFIDQHPAKWAKVVVYRSENYEQIRKLLMQREAA